MNAGSALNSVRIAVREAPFRNGSDVDTNVLKYTDQCANSLLVDGNIYSFDHVFKANVTQAELYEVLIAPMVAKVLEGCNCTALAYGQTGTGKSYSMGMNADFLDLPKERVGVVPRVFSDIFFSIKERRENMPAADMQLSASFIEVYNEKAYDLLAESTLTPLLCRGQKFTGGVRKPINSQQDLQELLMLGTKSRHVRPTNMNVNSSRSHAIVTIHVSSAKRTAHLNVVDLAGTEGLRRTGHEGIARSEGVHINQGLLCINKVILSMSAGHRVIPYRDSVLTSVLQDSLHVNSYLTLLACVSPSVCDLSETNSTLRFAKNAKQLKLNPQQNLILSELKRKYSNTPFKRPLSTSTALKQPLTVRATAVNSTFSTPGKPKTSHKLQRYHSEIGLTPKAIKRAREELQLPLSGRESLDGTISSVNLSTTLNGSPAATAANAAVQPVLLPSIDDYMKLKLQFADILSAFNDMKQKLQQAQNSNTIAAQAPTLSISHTSLDSISEQPEQTPCELARCQLFSSSPNASEATLTRPTGYETSGVSAFESSYVSSVATNVPPSQPVAVRRSTRLLSRSYKGDNASALGSLSRHSPAQQMREIRRRSVRIIAKTELTSMPPPPPPIADKILANSKVHAANGARSQLSKLISTNMASGKSKNTRLQKHRSAILKLMNSSTATQLQLLPCIGPKTAFALVMHRTLLGGFKNWNQIMQLPIWRGLSWGRFAKANCIVL